MTVVRNGGLIPLPNRPVVVIETLPMRPLWQRGAQRATLAQALADLGAEVAAYYITPKLPVKNMRKPQSSWSAGLVIMVTKMLIAVPARQNSRGW